MLRSLNIAIGNFFFRRRNFVFPCVFLLTACTTTPEIFLGSQTLDLQFVGSGADEQLQRTLRQSQRMAAASGDGLLHMPTDGKSPQELAETILHETGWLVVRPG